MKNAKNDSAMEGLKAIQKLEQKHQLENIIKNNKIEFKINDILYRVRKPNLSEQKEADNFRRRKYLELVLDNSYLFKKQWVEKYQKKGIDIPKKETEIRTLQVEIKNLMLRLAKNANQKEVDKLVKEIEELENKQRSIAIDVTDLLSYCIENQITYNVNSYITYLVLEKKNENKWIRVFDSYNNFEKSNNNELLGQAFYFINFLIYEEKDEFKNSQKNS